MATKIRAVQAFRRSLKRSTREKEKQEDGVDGDGKTAKSGEISSSKELAALCKSPLSCSQSDPATEGERRRRREEDDINYEVRERLEGRVV